MLNITRRMLRYKMDKLGLGERESATADQSEPAA
jgi:hypothetical protein